MADRILTTHIGSLPRSADVTDLIFAHERGEAVNAAEFDRVIGVAVGECVARQVAAGIDLVSDGQMSKISYATYIKDRITGLDEIRHVLRPPIWSSPASSSARRPAAALRPTAAPAASARSRPRR